MKIRKIRNYKRKLERSQRTKEEWYVYYFGL